MPDDGGLRRKRPHQLQALFAMHEALIVDAQFGPVLGPEAGRGQDRNDRRNDDRIGLVHRSELPPIERIPHRADRQRIERRITKGIGMPYRCPPLAYCVDVHGRSGH
jgi:hypothetical protein